MREEVFTRGRQASQLAGTLLLFVAAGCEAAGSAARSDAQPPVVQGSDAGDAIGADTARDAATLDGASACREKSTGAIAAEWPLPDPTNPTGPRAQTYDLSQPGVVIDKVTGLGWQRAVDPGKYSFVAAKEHCGCLTLGGFDDWRVPNRMELVTLVDFTRDSPAIDRTAFPDTPSEWFWTGSLLAADPTFAWYIYFETGFTNFIDLDQTYRVRCVRGGTTPASGPRYEVAAETVRDTRTGLTWQRNVDDVARTWKEAAEHCSKLPLGGGGWRLPDMKELQSLVDQSRSEPALDPVAFPNGSSETFWSGSSVLGFANSAWRVSFIHGYTYDAMVENEYHARCVR